MCFLLLLSINIQILEMFKHVKNDFENKSSISGRFWYFSENIVSFGCISFKISYKHLIKKTINQEQKTGF